MSIRTRARPGSRESGSKNSRSRSSGSRENKAVRPKTGRGTRRRRTPDEARAEALLSARRLLLEEGPNAVTLQRVAADVGMTHSNLLHHFGTAADLQASLMVMMVHDLTTALAEAVTHLESDQGAPRALVDMVFDAFDKGGAGRLAAWIALSGNLPQLDAIQAAIDSLVKALSQKFANTNADVRMGVTSTVLLVSLMAFGDAVVGDALKDMLKRERTAPRKIVTFLLSLLLDPQMRTKLP